MMIRMAATSATVSSASLAIRWLAKSSRRLPVLPSDSNDDYDSDDDDDDADDDDDTYGCYFC